MAPGSFTDGDPQLGLSDEPDTQVGPSQAEMVPGGGRRSWARAPAPLTGLSRTRRGAGWPRFCRFKAAGGKVGICRWMVGTWQADTQGHREWTLSPCMWWPCPWRTGTHLQQLLRKPHSPRDAEDLAGLGVQGPQPPLMGGPEAVHLSCQDLALASQESPCPLWLSCAAGHSSWGTRTEGLSRQFSRPSGPR